MRVRVGKYLFLSLLVCLAALPVCAQPVHKYSCEVGVQAGVGYYIGEAADYIFTPSTMREVLGGQFRYKFDERWALQTKAQFHHTTGKIGNSQFGYELTDERWHNKMINIDVCAEYNFFRFGPKCLDTRVKQFTPYMFVGLGCSVFGEKALDGTVGSIYGLGEGDYTQAAMYVPMGLGLKWKFSDRCGLTLSWQHNWYILGSGIDKERLGADNLEGVELMDNWQATNGRNFLHNDRTGQLTLGFVFEFAMQRHVCVFCRNNY